MLAKKILLSLVRPTIFCFLFANATVVFSQSSSFTYQGRLNDGGTPANGNYDLEFRLFDVESGGSALATQQRLNVAVSAGIFTSTLDFGASFTGGQRFLEIGVRAPGGSSFTTLNPRQAITSTPYAIRSLNAGAADTATNATQLGGIAASQYVLTGDARLTDARPPTAGSSNYIQNRTTQQGASNFNISGNGIIGGRLGVGAANPVARIHILDNTNGASAYFENTGTGQAVFAQGATTTGTIGGTESGLLGIGNAGVIGRTFGTGNPITSIGVLGDAAAATGDTTGVRGESASTSGVGVSGWATNPTGSTIGVEGRSVSTSPFAVGVKGSGITGVLGQSVTGLGVTGRTINASIFQASSAGVWGDSSTSIGILGTSTSNAGVRGRSDISMGVYGNSSSGTGGIFTSQIGVGVEGNGVIGGNFISSSTTGYGIRGYGDTAGYFESSGGRGVDAFGGAYGGFFNTTGNGIGINVHSVGGVAIFARSENTHALHADGSILVNRWIVLNELRTGGGTQVCRNSSNELSSCASSSIRYKDNIGSFDYGLNVVRKLRPITFDWKTDGTHDVGLVAEEVEKVAPKLTVYENGQVEGVRYDKLSIVLINAVKEQQAQIEAQKEQMSSMRTEIEVLKQLVCASNSTVSVRKK